MILANSYVHEIGILLILKMNINEIIAPSADLK